MTGERPEYAYLEAITGTVQTLNATAPPSQIALRLRDMNGNPMAGGTPTLYQAVRRPNFSSLGRRQPSRLLTAA